MSTHFIFPKPKDWDTFEDIVCDVFVRKFNNYNLQRYGRSGQRQSGVDIAGLTQSGLLGLQCKHHPSGNISTSEIDEEITKSEGFRPSLNEFIIVTSADRDVNAHRHVLERSQERQAQGQYHVAIKFWPDIYNWLIDFPDLVYKHFTKHFPPAEFENIVFPNQGQISKTTAVWPVSFEEFYRDINKSLGGVKKVEPYKLTIGITTFADVTYKGLVDLEIQLADLYTDEGSSEKGFAETASIFNQVKSLLRRPDFSNEIWLCSQVRLSSAFLLGWVFRRVSNFDLRLVARDQIWATSGLPLVAPRLSDGLPILGDSENKELVLILNMSRHIEESVHKFVRGWEQQPMATLTYNLEGNRVLSAAHALSLSITLSQKIKTVIDKWGIQRIYLFGAMPAGLATLISYHLNAICPISIYFLDSSRNRYRIGGTLTNNL